MKGSALSSVSGKLRGKSGKRVIPLIFESLRSALVSYLPLDKAAADLLFQIVSQRYERGSIIVTTNKAYKHWPAIFHNDADITAAILDRLLHRAQTIVVEGTSYRMKDGYTESTTT